MAVEGCNALILISTIQCAILDHSVSRLEAASTRNKERRRITSCCLGRVKRTQIPSCWSDSRSRAWRTSDTTRASNSSAMSESTWEDCSPRSTSQAWIYSTTTGTAQSETRDHEKEEAYRALGSGTQVRTSLNTKTGLRQASAERREDSKGSMGSSRSKERRRAKRANRVHLRHGRRWWAYRHEVRDRVMVEK